MNGKINDERAHVISEVPATSSKMLFKWHLVLILLFLASMIIMKNDIKLIRSVTPSANDALQKIKKIEQEDEQLKKDNENTKVENQKAMDDLVNAQETVDKMIDAQDELQKLATPENVRVVVLQPPYRIASLGEPRTGSTFMHQLLYAIVRIKTPADKNVQVLRNKPGDGNFVTKSHYIKKTKHFLRNQIEKGSVSIFISTKDREHVQFDRNISSKALYIQETVNLRACSLCEVDAYKDIFNLTDAEIQHVKDYMAIYEILRQCCGSQMSRWERMRLHGCNITEEDKTRPDYPQKCENLNKTEVELKMASNPGGIKWSGMDKIFNWMKVGDCKKFDKVVANGSDFNGKKFTTSVKTCNALKRKGT